jgi:hypothetical protein
MRSDKWSRKKLKAEGFFCTDPDTNQWVKKISDTQFMVYEKGRMFDVDLTEYTDEELDDYIAAYYPALEDMREMYGENANQIIAECIAETDCY